MTDDSAFMAGLLRNIQDGIVDLKGRLGTVERRQTASTHLEQSVIAHIASVHESVDNLRAEIHRMNERLVDVEKVVHAPR